MNPAYTYRNKHGVFYFRRVLSNGNRFSKTELRFSLRTRATPEAQFRAYSAWIAADSMISNGCTDVDRMRQEIQSTIFLDGVHEVPRPSTISYGPELVRLADVAKSYDVNLLQDVVAQVQDSDGEIFAPYASRDCSFYEIHDDVHKDVSREPFEAYLFIAPTIVLTASGVESAISTLSGTFQVEEFYSYYPGGYIRNIGFVARIVPVKSFSVRVSQLLIAKEVADNLTIYTQSPSASRTGTSDSSYKPILDELTRYCDIKQERKRWTDRTRKDNAGVFNTFVEIIGNIPINEITQSDVEKYEDKLRFLPPNRNKLKAFRGMNALQASDLNYELGGEVLSDRSKQKYLDRLSGPFRSFVKQGKCSHNFFSGLEPYDLGDEEEIDKREPFSTEDLQLMFSGENSIKILSSKNYYPSRVWGPLIALYTGARAEEIYALQLINIGCEDGTDFFSIKNMGRHSRVKNVASRRKIPVHPMLIELGLMEYISKSRKAQRKVSNAMLFPELTKSVYHGWSRNTTRWFNEQYLPKLGIKTDKKVFHSFRHTLVDQLKRTPDINDLHASQYIGHKDKKGPFWKTGSYGSRFTPTELLGITDCINYEIDFIALKEKCLDKLKPRCPRVKVGKN